MTSYNSRTKKIKNSTEKKLAKGMNTLKKIHKWLINTSKDAWHHYHWGNISQKHNDVPLHTYDYNFIKTDMKCW